MANAEVPYPKESSIRLEGTEWSVVIECRKLPEGYYPTCETAHVVLREGDKAVAESPEMDVDPGEHKIGRHLYPAINAADIAFSSRFGLMGVFYTVIDSLFHTTQFRTISEAFTVSVSPRIFREIVRALRVKTELELKPGEAWPAGLFVDEECRTPEPMKVLGRGFANSENDDRLELRCVTESCSNLAFVHFSADRGCERTVGDSFPANLTDSRDSLVAAISVAVSRQFEFRDLFSAILGANPKLKGGVQDLEAPRWENASTRFLPRGFRGREEPRSAEGPETPGLAAEAEECSPRRIYASSPLVVGFTAANSDRPSPVSIRQPSA